MGEQLYFHQKCLQIEQPNKSRGLRKQNQSLSTGYLSKDSMSEKCKTYPEDIESDLPPSCVDRQTSETIDSVDSSQLIRRVHSDIGRIQATGRFDGVPGSDVHKQNQAVNSTDPKLNSHESGKATVETVPAPQVDSGHSRSPVVELCHREARHQDNGDHIETISYHPEPPAQSSDISKSEKSRESKLRKATKAILSLKRATSSLTSHHGDNSSIVGSSRGFRGFIYPKSLISSFWRQNTADNSTCTRSARLDSVNSLCNWGQSTDSSTFHNGASQYDLSQKTQHRLEMDQVSTNSSTFRLPQFIVPRMNALKLPIVCLIKSLDGELMREIFIHRYEVGQYLIDNLKVSLGIKDAKYFGLKLAKSIDEQEDVRQPWLELNVSVYKQISKHSKSISISDQSNQQGVQATTKSIDLYLRIKFYPPNLARIQDLFLKKYLWLQLRRDLRLGKLTSSMNNLTFLMACALQFELGDFESECISEKLPELNVLPNQDMIEQQAIEIWKTRLTGSKKHQVQMQFLRASVILETYGFDYYPVRDHQRQRAYLLGFNYAGVKTVRNGRIVHHFRWHSLSKISHERRMIIFHIYPTENSKRKQILGFKCLSNEDCSNLYMRLQEQKYFFTVDLTYFDKSMRRPSHLAESTLDQKDQQELFDWTGTSGASNTLDTYEDDLDELSDAADSQNQHSVRNQGRDHVGQVEPSQNNSHLTEQPVNLHESPSLGSRGRFEFDGCNCATCKRDLQLHQQHLHSNNQSMDSSLSGHPMSPSSASATPIIRNAHLMKSCSLQESSTGITRDTYNTSNSPNSFVSQSNSPPAHVDQSECCLNGSCGASRISHSDMTNHRPRANVSHLQRQCSLLKYSPDFEMINETAREQDSSGSAIDAQEANRVGECVASWTEQVLTQPARIFTCTNWPIGQQEVHQRTRQSGLSNHPSDSSLFMQGLFFCLLILALDLGLRLSDGISSAVQGLLAFRSAGQEAAAQPAASYSSINDYGSLR